MLFKSGIVSVASGSLGGLTASHNKGGMYLRARTVPTNPSTAGQVIVRAALGTLSSRWVNVLTQEQRDAWDVYAFNTPLTGPLGDARTVSGLAMYVRSNVPRIQADRTLKDTAPTSYTVGTFTPITGLSNVASANILDFTINDSDDWALQADSALLIYIGRAQNPSINYFKGPYQFAGIVEGNPVPIGNPQTVTPPFPMQAGNKLFVRFIVTEIDARLSMSQFASVIST